MNTVHPPMNDPFRTGKAYTVREVAKLAKTTPATVRRWLKGYDAPGHHMEPVFGDAVQATGKVLQVSFLELIEIAVAIKFRTNGAQEIPLERIRRAHSYAKREWLVPFPFATMKFKLFGGHIMHDFEVKEPGAGHMAFDMGGQWALPDMVLETVVEMDFDVTDEYASIWYPFGRDTQVVIDPHFAAGRPTVKGTRIPVQTIQERWDAGDSIAYLAKDYSLKTSIVEEILRLAVA